MTVKTLTLLSVDAELKNAKGQHAKGQREGLFLFKTRRCVIGLRHEPALCFSNKRNKRTFTINWAEFKFSQRSFQHGLPQLQPRSIPLSPDCLQIPLRTPEERGITAVWEQQQRAALGPWSQLKSGGAPDFAPLLEDTWAERIKDWNVCPIWSVSYLTALPTPWLGKRCKLEIQMAQSVLPLPL